MTARHAALDLSGQVIVITGGAGALGEAITTTLVAHGAKVGVLDIVERESSDPRLTYRRTDVTDALDVDAALAEVAQAFGAWPTTVLCHAGVVGTHPLVDYPVDEFENLMHLNVGGAFVSARQAARSWRERGMPGHLIFTTSWVHQVSWPEIGPYTASKAAVVQLSRAFARELATDSIRANAVAPGIVAAGMAKHQWDTVPDYRERASRAIPLGALQSPQSVADAFLFLCSDLASYMTGSVLTVDGGASLYPN